MSALTIAIASDDEVRTIALGRRRRQFNYGIVGEYPEGQNVWLNGVLFVDESARRKGIGARLLAEGEAHARQKGARTTSTGMRWR